MLPQPLDAVEGEQRDTIALDEAEVRKRVGKARRALVPLRERQRAAGILSFWPVLTVSVTAPSF